MTIHPSQGFVGTKELSARPWNWTTKKYLPFWVFALGGDYELKEVI
jgi:hypothetical protein